MKALVFDIGGTSIKYGVCTDGVLSGVSETPTRASSGARHIMETVSSLIAEQSGYDAIGISTAGQVNPDTGTIIYANSNLPGYTGTEIRQELTNQFHVPVMVENDVNSAAMGEGIYGAGAGFRDFLCLTYGTGVGGAIIQNGALYRGSSFSAGEFGGIVIHGNKKLSGNDVLDGCYERCASTTALVKKASELDPALDSGRAIFAQLERAEVKQLLEDWTDEILLGLSTLIHIFNPSCVVLGGGIMAQPYILELLRHKLAGYIMSSFSHVKLVAASLGNKAGMYGIYYLTSQYLLSLHGKEKG